MTKMTKKVAFALALDALKVMDSAEAAEAVEVVEKELARLERVASKAKSGETKADKEKAEFRQTVLELVADSDHPVRSAEVAKALDVSVQKATAALTALVKDGALVKGQGEKRTVVFSTPELAAELTEDVIDG